MYVVQPPNHAPSTNQLKVFLAGSIEQGKAEDWQSKIINSLNGIDCCLFNPRRQDWDSSWAQSIDHPEFTKQVVWEMERILESDLVIFYFQPGTKSPISIGEIYYAAAAGKTCFVCCPEGFWRKGNIDIVCARHQNVSTCASLEDLVRKTSQYIRCNPCNTPYTILKTVGS